jgi:hypothetical protein
MVKILTIFLLSFFVTRLAISQTTSSKITDQSILIRTESRNDVNKALSNSVASTAKEAREEKLSNNAVIFRRNAIPAKIILKSNSGEIDQLILSSLVIETDEVRDNDLFRDILESYSSISKNTYYTTILTRKDNWIRGDQKITVGNSNAAYAHTTVFQRLYPQTSGTGLITGDIFKKKNSEIACDLIEEEELVTTRTLCIQDGAKLSIGETAAAWATVNKANVVRVYFEHKNITIDQFRELYKKILLMKDFTASIIDINNKELFRLESDLFKVSFVRLDDRNGKPCPSLTDLPDNNTNFFNLKVWITDAKSFKFPCVCEESPLCAQSGK